MLKTHKLPTPLAFSKGDYVGISSRSSVALGLRSIAAANHESGKNSTIFYGSSIKYGDGTKALTEWKGDLCFGFRCLGGSGGGLIAHFNLQKEAVWNAPSDKYKGWGVKTALLGTPATTGGCLKTLLVKNFGGAAGRRELNVVVMRRGTAKNFEVVRSCEIPTYDGKKDVLNTFQLSPPLEYVAGDYVGVTARSNSLDIMSIAGSNHASGKGRKIFYGGARKMGDGSSALTEWEGALCFGFISAATRLNLGHPIWTVQHSQLKGWGVKTAILGKPQVKSGVLTDVSIKHYQVGSREINVVVMSRPSSTSRYFSVKREYQIPAYSSTAFGIKQHKLSTPIAFSTGDYVGLTSRGPPLEVASISDSQHAAGKHEGATIYYGDKRSAGDGSKAVGFVGEVERQQGGTVDEVGTNSRLPSQSIRSDPIPPYTHGTAPAEHVERSPLLSLSERCRRLCGRCRCGRDSRRDPPRCPCLDGTQGQVQGVVCKVDSPRHALCKQRAGPRCQDLAPRRWHSRY